MLVRGHDICVGREIWPSVEDPSKRLCHDVGRVDNARVVFHKDATLFMPVLNGKELDVDVGTLFRRDAMVDDLDG